MPPTGTILAGRYRVGRTRGAGGMGVVLEGTHIELATPVAIKVLHDQLARDPDRVERFLREARAAAQLRGEHVCRVHDCGTHDDGAPFIVMELLSGCDLATLLEQLGPLAPEVVASYMRQACAGVAEAHALGIVHRDLKPTNIFRTHRPDGSALIKILDFGLAKSMNGQDPSLTQTANVVGSPRYMSPEQLRSSKVVDPRSDIWSLGVVMYQLLTAKLPFDGETAIELALNITNDPPAPLPDSVPSALAAVVMRCLEKNPARRYWSVAELSADLEAHAKAPPAPEFAAGAAQPARSPSPTTTTGDVAAEPGVDQRDTPRAGVHSRKAEPDASGNEQPPPSGSAIDAGEPGPRSRSELAAVSRALASDGGDSRWRRTLLPAVAALVLAGAVAVYVVRARHRSPPRSHAVEFVEPATPAFDPVSDGSSQGASSGGERVPTTSVTTGVPVDAATDAVEGTDDTVDAGIDTPRVPPRPRSSRREPEPVDLSKSRH